MCIIFLVRHTFSYFTYHMILGMGVVNLHGIIYTLPKTLIQDKEKESFI